MHGQPSFFHRWRGRACLPALILAVVFPALQAQPIAPDEPVVMLPPFMVEERGKALQWHYYATPGREMLAACDPALAANVAERVIQLDHMMSVILPARFLAAAPETLILVDKSVEQRQAREVLAEAMKRKEVRLLPNLRLLDTDMSVTFAVVTPETTEQFFYTPDRIAALLEQRVPRLPDWFAEGFEGFYRQITQFFKDGKWIGVGPATWISPKESKALRDDPNRAHRVLMPMAEFFAHRKDPSAVAGEKEAARRAQAALFVRWAQLENNGADRAALWSFVDRLEREPASEALFRECFGRGYASVQNELIDYLPRAVDVVQGIKVPPAAGENLPRPKLRPATDLEVARLLGDWQRLEIGYVRENSPEVANKYAAQAQKTLGRARGEGDPRLLAAMGLTRLEAGDLKDARLLLEMAAAGKVVRPRVYVELARLRYAAIVRAAGPQAKLTAAEVAEVLGPLSEGQRQNPPLLENYVLFSEVVGRSMEPPTATQLAALHEGALKFPHASDLVARAVYFHLASNQPAAAAALIAVGLRYARDPAMRDKFERASASFRGTKMNE